MNRLNSFEIVIWTVKVVLIFFLQFCSFDSLYYWPDMWILYMQKICPNNTEFLKNS